MSDLVERLRHILIIATAISVPLSLRLFLPQWGVEVIFPAEPLLGLLAVVNSIGLRQAWKNSDRKTRMLRSPVTYLTLGWIAFHLWSSVHSSDSLASLKALFVQIVYVLALVPPVFALVDRGLGIQRDAHDAAFALIVIYTLNSSIVAGMDRMATNFAPFPFYMDHTLYSAVLTFMFIRFIRNGALPAPTERYVGRTVFRWVAGSALAFALVYSFGRASWAGLAVVVCIIALHRLRLPMRVMLVAPVLLVLMTIVLREPVQNAILRASTASQLHGTGPMETLRSIPNLTTDQSNLDRVLRWKAAFRMFMDRPWTGHGAGTYQRLHAGYLSPDELSHGRHPRVVAHDDTRPFLKFGTTVAVRDHAGRSPSSGGTAHSEYLLSLAEHGLAGGLWWLVVVLLVWWRTITMMWRGTAPAHIITAGLALIAFLVHVAFNNYLDDCKAAFLFWPCLALLLTRIHH